MTVRAVEKLAAEQAAKAEKPAKKRKTTDQYYKEMELELTDRLQRKVSVTYGRKKGTLMLEFSNKKTLHHWQNSSQSWQNRNSEQRRMTDACS